MNFFKKLRAVRGAVCCKNEADDILHTITLLYTAILEKNRLKERDIVSILFAGAFSKKLPRLHYPHFTPLLRPKKEYPCVFKRGRGTATRHNGREKILIPCPSFVQFFRITVLQHRGVFGFAQAYLVRTA